MQEIQQHKICHIHPVVILSISDYFNRMSISSNGKITQVFGGLYGVKNSQNKFEIFYSIEFLSKNNSFDPEFIKSRKELSDHLFRNQNYELIGYFLTYQGNLNDLKDKKFEENLIKNQGVLNLMKNYSINNPICLLLSTNMENESDLPISLYNVNINNNSYEKILNKIEGNESERITLDSVMNNCNIIDNSSNNNNSQNLKTYKNAYEVLKGKLNGIIAAAKSEKFKNDEKFKEMFSHLISNIPKIDNEENALNPMNLKNLLEDKEIESLIINSINLSVINKYCERNNLSNNDRKFDNNDGAIKNSSVNQKKNNF